MRDLIKSPRCVQKTLKVTVPSRFPRDALNLEGQLLNQELLLSIVLPLAMIVAGAGKHGPSHVVARRPKLFPPLCGLIKR